MQPTTTTSHAMQTNNIPNILPVWIAQTGPIMPLSDVDQWPVVILSQYATADQIEAAKSALMTIP